MELKPGYKQTEVGVIPEDWEIKTLGELGQAIIGLTYKPEQVAHHGTLVLRSSNIQDCALTFDDNVYVVADIPCELMVQDGDVLICVRNGSRDLIGKTALLDERANSMTFGAFMAVFRSPIGSLINYHFQSSALKKQISAHLGATINQITNKSLRSFQVILPPTKRERDSMVEALQDMDGLIRDTNSLIQKKRQIKQAAMQELLTGKRRLPGFEGEWKTVAISQIAEKITGFWGRTEPGNEAIHSTNVIRAGDISEDGRLISAACRYFSHHEISVAGCRSGDTVMTASGNGLGKSWTCSQDGVYSASNFVRIIRPLRGKADGHFIGYALKSRRSRSKLIEHTATSAYPNLKPSFFNDSWLPLPPEAEQNAISRVLQDIDIEILELEARKLKASQLKQGMMQQLLTGKIRLI